MQMLSRKLNLKAPMNQLQVPSSDKDTDNPNSNSGVNGTGLHKTRSRTISNPWLHYSDFFKNKSFLIPDTVAFATILPYFRSTPGFSSKFKITMVELIGYEAYFVEQWISSRGSNSLIVTYTGDQNDRILAYHVQSLLTDVKVDNLTNSPLDAWPSKFVSYLIEQLESPFCVATDTTMGYAFITNLAQLNPFLSLIEAKTGNIIVDYELFVVNHNLRKLGCGSRSAATTDEPSKSMELKFKSTFAIDHRVKINYAVINLIQITQTFLFYYGLLDPIYCDGLLCDQTETAINKWWLIVSKVPLYTHIIKNRPPNCSICDSIQAIVGFTLLCRHLLELGGNNFGVPKDVMEVKKVIAAIGRFQKSTRISETSIFDGDTLIRLFDWAQNAKTSQNITKDLNKMKNLVKNTVIDITSGKNLQSIAQNANISPFHVYSNYEASKFINCQNYEHFKHIPMGKQLSYLINHSGKPIELQKSSLAIETIKQHAAEAAAESNSSNVTILNGVRRLTNQLNMPSDDIKTEQGTAKIANLNDSGIFTDDEDSDAINTDAVYNDDAISVAESMKEEEDINKKLKKRFKIRLSTPFLSSDDEAPEPTNVESTDEIDEGITSYKPNKKNRTNFKSSRASSIGGSSVHNDELDTEAVEKPYTQDNKLSVAPRKHRGSSLSSHFRFSRKNNNHSEIFEDEDVISDSEYYKSNKSSRRNTQLLNGNTNGGTDALNTEAANIKSVYALPHAINAADLSDISISGKQDPTADDTNDIESDGVYEYEQGFEYDYEVDGDTAILKKDNKLTPTEPHNELETSNKSSSISLLYNDDTDILDSEYCAFKNRLKRRHSIPLVPCEMNKYSIQMLARKKADMNNSINTCNVPESRYRGSLNKINTWDCAISNPTESEQLDVKSFALRRNRSVYGNQSLNTIDSHYLTTKPVILYSNPIEEKPLRRSCSFSSLENSFTFDGENSDVYGFEVSNKQFLTSETLAIYYLKMQARYQFDLLQRSKFVTQYLKRSGECVKVNNEFEQAALSPVSLTYSTPRGDTNKAVVKYYELEDKIKNTSKDNARLKYELRLLLQKTKEVENNLKTLEDFKIRTLDGKIDSMICGTKVNTYYAAKFKSMLGEESGTNDGDGEVDGDQSNKNSIYSAEGHINWKAVTWERVYSNPRIIIYLFFHMVLCTVLKRVDPQKLEARWRQIDKDQTVTAAIKNMYAPYTSKKTSKEVTPQPIEK